MNTNNILNATILDIIFENRNKLYGAYQLRKTYNSRLIKALLLTAILVLLFFLGTMFAKNTDKVVPKVDILETQMAEIKKEVIPPVLPPPKQRTTTPKIKNNTVKFVPPVIVKNDEVKPDEEINTIDEQTAIGAETIKSNNTTDYPIEPPTHHAGTDITNNPQPDDGNDVFTKVEVEASFPGGNAAWLRYLQKTLNANIPIDNGAPAGSYTVIVQFIVSKDGTVSDVTATTSHGYGMEAEAIRAIKKSGKWNAARQNGNHVNAYRMQPITFLIEN